MFVPLHLKSHYSLVYGCASIEEIVDRAVALGFPAIALTDIENLYGQVEFHHRCRQRGILPLTGLELRRGFDGHGEMGSRTGRLVLLAADQSGYRNLCRIISHRRSSALTEKQLLTDPVDLLIDHSEGLFVLSDDPEVVERLIVTGMFDRKMLGLLVIRPQEPDGNSLLLTAASLGVRLVADLDCVFLQQEDHPLHLLQCAIRKRKLLEELTDLDFEGAERWLRPPVSAMALFADLPEALSATAEIAAACRLELGPLTVGKPDFDLHGDGSASESLRRLCQKAMSGKISTGGWSEAHHIRLEQELAVFENLGFTGFMLLVAEILTFCRETGIPVFARGSAVSSLTLHLLGGSPVDPLAEGLLFERFLHAGKSTWPDVDLDLPWHRREEVINWVYQHFGHQNVAMVAAHHTFQYRSALRLGLKAWGAQPTHIKRLTKALPRDEPAVSEVDFLDLAKTAIEDDPLAGESLPILQLIRRLVGRPRHIAVHPGGIVIDRRPLQDFLPLERAPKGVVITQYDLMAVSRLGLVKIDLLGNRCLSELEETLELAELDSPRGLETIPANDPATLELINPADTIGCFQMESPAMRSMLTRLPIRHQSDLTAALALIRPGAAAGEVKTIFIRRARGEEPEQAEFPFMADRLAETHGLFLYEEDIMVLLSRSAGLTLEEADELRRAIIQSGSDPALLSTLEASYTAKGKYNDADGSLLGKAWATATRLAAYSFNKAHAASYAMLAYYSAYTKANYPIEFACSLLNHHQGMYPLRVVVADFIRRGISLIGPNVNHSRYHSLLEMTVSQNKAVRVGLDKVRGFSRSGVTKLLNERDRNGPFTSLQNLLTRVQLSRGEIAALIYSGACDELSPLSTADYPFAQDAAMELFNKGGGPEDLKSLIIPRPVSRDEKVQLYQALVRVRNELRYIGMQLLAHPLKLLRDEATRYRCVTIAIGAAGTDEYTLRLAVILAAMKRIKTRQGTLLFLTLEDETGLLEAVVLPTEFRRSGHLVSSPGPYLVEGRLRRQQGAVYLEITGINPFHLRRQPYQ